MPSSPAAPAPHATTYYDVDGLIIGRHGPREGGTVVRLGTVARQLLRGLPAAVMVVPPEHEEWVDNYGLGGARTETSPGDPVEQTLKLAQAHDASIIVCGSRRLSLADRVFQASTGSTLAAYARRPVVVVPPESMVRVPG